MSKPLVYLITFVVCLFLQMGVAPAIAISGCAPIFLLIPVLLVAMRSGAAAGGSAGFVMGLMFDLIGDGTVGCMALVFTLVGLIIGIVTGGMDASSILLSCIVAVVSSLFAEFAYGISCILTSPDAHGIMATLVFHALPEALYTAVFAAIALVTIRFVVAEDPFNVTDQRLGKPVGGSAPNLPRMKSRLK